MSTAIGHFIDGARAPNASGRKAPSYNPATGEQTGLVSLAGIVRLNSILPSGAPARDGAPLFLLTNR